MSSGFPPKKGRRRRIAANVAKLPELLHAHRHRLHARAPHHASPSAGRTARRSGDPARASATVAGRRAAALSGCVDSAPLPAALVNLSAYFIASSMARFIAGFSLRRSRSKSLSMASRSRRICKGSVNPLLNLIGLLPRNRHEWFAPVVARRNTFRFLSKLLRCCVVLP